MPLICGWRRLLRFPWTAKRSNHSILKEISPEYLLGRLMLKLKLQFFGLLMRSTDSFEKTLMLGKIEGRRSRGRQRTRWFHGITDSTDLSLSKLQETVKASEVWHETAHGVSNHGPWLSDWTTTELSRLRFPKLEISASSLCFYVKQVFSAMQQC